MARPGTQLISRKALASSNTPAYIKEVEALLEAAITKSAEAKSKEQKRTIKIPDLEKALGILSANRGDGKPEAEHLLALAEVNWELENAKESIAFLKEAIQLAPKDARPYGLLGRYLLNKGLRDQAMNFLDRAIQLDPDDHGSRRLRDRAARQANKSYTVVANAAEAAGDKPSEKKTANKMRAEATRLLDVDALKAGAVLEEVDAQLQNEVDAALAALLGVSMTNADLSILEGQRKKGGASGVFRTGCAFIVIAMLGLAVGGVFWRLRPQIESRPGTEVELRLADATANRLAELLQMSNTGESKTTMPQQALAHAMMYADHGGDVLEFDSAVDLLFPPTRDKRTVSEAEMTTPEALLARALLQSRIPAPKDKTLDADLAAAEKPAGAFGRAWLQMARAERAVQKNDFGRAVDALDDVALLRNAPPRAVTELARGYALKGEIDLALGILEHLWRTSPEHVPSLALGVALAVEDATRQIPPPVEGERPPILETTAVEKRVLKLFVEEKLTGVDAAELALVVAATHAGRGDERDGEQPNAQVVGKMLTRAQGPAEESAALLANLVELYLMRVQPPKAKDLLDKGNNLAANNVDLILDSVRTKLLGDLPPKALITLRAFTKPHIEPGRLYLPGGYYELAPKRRPYPLLAVFDARYFPEREIKNAIDVSDPRPNVVNNLLKNVADLKLAEILLVRVETNKTERASNLKDATKYLDRVLKNRGENDPRYYLLKAQLLRARGENADAKEAIEDALNIESNDPRILVAAAKIHLEAGDERAALSALKKLDEGDYKSPTAMLLRAQILSKRGKDDKARAYMAEAAALAPSNLDLTRSLMRIEAGAGNLDAAVAAAKRLEQAETGDEEADRAPLLSALLARDVLLDGKASEAAKAAAVTAVDDAAKDSSRNAIIFLIKGDAHAGSGDTDGAASAYKRAKKLGGSGPVSALAAGRLAGGKSDPGAETSPKKKPKRKKKKKGRSRR